MPRKAFLKKKSLLDRFKDDYATHTGYIQSARAKHTWNNPLTRRKRTKELNRWIKSFAGKDHIHKLARFNAQQAGKNEDANSNVSIAYHISPTKFEKFRLMPKSGMGTTFYGRGIYLTYDKSVIDHYKNLLADYYDNLYIYTVIISPKAKIISEDEIFDYIDDSVDLEDSEQVANLLKNKVDGIRYYNDEDGNSVVIFNDDLVSIKSRQDCSMKNEAMSLKGFLENLTEKLTKQFDLDSEEVQAYLNSHTQEMQELLDDKELSLKEKVLFVRSEITGEKDEAKKSERLFNKRKMERIALSEGSKVSPYLVEIAHKILTDEYGWKASTIEEVADWLGDHKQAFEHAYGQALRSSDDDKANVKAGIEAALDEEERGVMNAEIAMMGESKKHEGYGGTKSVMSIWGNRPRDVYPEVSYSSVNDMYNTLLKYGYGDKHPIYYKNNSPEQIKGHILGYFKWTPTNSDADIEADALAAATMIKNNFNKSESKEPADEKLGYEKGHKNSRGENAPWVIRSHEDNRILASFANKKDAEEHLKRMKQYSKTEKKSEAVEESDFIKDFRARMESMIGEPYDEDDILGYGWVWKSEDIGYPNGNKTYYEYFSLSDDGVPYTMEIGYNSFNETISSFKMWQEASEKKSEASNLAGYTSDIVSELDTIWGCGEDGAKRLVGKYADVIQQNYTDGDLLASETAKFIAGQENLKESRNKSESKKSEGRLELVDTIIIPKWLWEAYNFGNDYGEDLDEHEQEILAKFQEKYSDLYLDDHDEEADFYSRNDFDEYGGPCYEVDVYEMKKA